MAPHVPEEVDVFTIPHSRMKELVNDYAEMVKNPSINNTSAVQCKIWWAFSLTLSIRKLTGVPTVQ